MSARQSHAVVRPSRLKLHSTELACDVLRSVGYRARCACGWRGPLRDRHHEARADGRAHLCEASTAGE